MADEQRLDAVVVARGFATGRDKAKELIRSGSILVNGKAVCKPSLSVLPTDEVACTAETPLFVGRGGLKLEHAFSQLPPLAAGYIAMDVGASTGGFTQCLLLHGAAKVYAVDVGHGQLHPSLLADARVVNLEGMDIRADETLQAIVPAHAVDMVAVDVSFISLRCVLPHVLPYLKQQGYVMLLIKPQFEAGKAAVGKNGVVHDRREHYRLLRELYDYFLELDCGVQRLTYSPIIGGAGRRDGNIEYLAVLQQGGAGGACPDIRRLVDTAFSELK